MIAWIALGALWVLPAVAPDRVAAYGRVSANERTLALPSSSGAPSTVKELLVKEGDLVTRGQALAVTDGEPLAAADLAIARARLAAAEETLRAVNAGPKTEEVAAQEAQVQAAAADARALKARKLADTTAGKNEAAAQVDAALARAAAAQHQLAALREVRPALAQAEVDEAKASFARAETVLAACRVTAPADGQVLRVLAYPGEGAAGRGLLELGDTAHLTIKAELNVADAFRVQPGARVTIKSEAWTGELAGTLTRVSPRVQRSTLTALSTFANVDRQIVEATVVPESPEKLAGRTGAEVTVSIEAAAAR